ncbi:MAG: MaoC/PaaZ C-terminal domain-containing protein [Pseudomonadota bacterium]
MTAGRPLAPGLYHHDDLRVGDHFATDGIKVTEAHVVGFAGLGGDFFSLHMDDDAARGLGFPARVVHGLLVLSLVDALKNRAEVRIAAVASLHWDWAFQEPVFIGDRIAARLTVAASRTTGNPERGIVELAFEVTNQLGEVVQAGTNRLMTRRRTPS